VDLAIRLRTKGHRCLYNPMVQAIHYESKTRPITSEELVYQQRIKKDYSEILSKDPFYNPNLSLDNEQFNGFRPFPIEKQISELRSLNIKVNTTKELCYKEPFSKHYPSIKS
jgi:hypothetical protein